MQLTVHSKNRFPHLYKLKKLGGKYCGKGEEYYEEHEHELSHEYAEIFQTISSRDKLGTNKIIHERKDL